MSFVDFMISIVTNWLGINWLNNFTKL